MIFPRIIRAIECHVFRLQSVPRLREIDRRALQEAVNFNGHRDRLRPH